MLLKIDIVPVPLARPRVTKRGTFLLKRSQQFRKDFQTLLRAAFHGTPLSEPLSVTLHFYKPIKTTARTYGDIDNLVKAVFDACNGILWLDDRQIVEMQCYKHKGAGKIEMEVRKNVDKDS
ncbi:MAG: RusA family crossover junction endodeoxyribonuclease [Selenomonadaceae bacterium]|nr:RusA family crossover junction endodeoxyribonuclease [Selenomonadaceae bacterium]